MEIIMVVWAGGGDKSRSWVCYFFTVSAIKQICFAYNLFLAQVFYLQGRSQTSQYGEERKADI